MTDVLFWKDLIDKLPRTTYAMHGSNRVDDISTCFEGTRTNVLGEITQWIHGEDDKCIFWVNGMAGVGKTTIARTIVERNKDILLASFFFSRDDEHASDHLRVFPTLAYQFARQRSQMMIALANMIQASGDCTAYPLKKQRDEFIVSPLKTLSGSRYTVLFVLDALDECSSKDGTSSILRLFLELESSIPCSVRLLVTSRPEKHIRDVFETAQNHAKIVLHDIEKTIVSGDIERFIRHELQVIFEEYRLPLPSDADIIRLVETSGSLFVFAATALRYIGDRVARNPKRRLEFILGNNENYKSRPYSAVDKLYWTILDEVVPTGHDSLEEIKDRFQRVIGTIVTLRDPLPLSALSSMVESEEDVHGALELLHSVIRVPASPREAPRVLHPSFVDFLTNNDRCTDPRLFINVSVQETRLAHRCLEIMAQSLKQNMAGIEDETMLNTEVAGLKGRVEKVLPGELRYACLHWASHVIATGDGYAGFFSSLEKFARECLLSWMEAMSLLGKVPRAILMLKDTHAWAVSVHWLDLCSD